MIIPGTHITLAEIAVERIVITEHQRRYPERVAHYVRLLSEPCHQNAHPGLIHLMPYGDDLYTILDGHHRYLASVIAGRARVLALILSEPGQRVPDEGMVLAIKEV